VQNYTPKAIIFHPALAPYRVDFFNSLNNAFDARFYFSYDNLIDQKFDQQQLRSQCRFEFRLLEKGVEIGGRSVRIGIFKILSAFKPDIVICSEYSQVTLFVLVLKRMFGLKFKLYTISDDSVDLSGKRSGIRKWLRDTVSHYVDGIIFPSELVCSWYHQQVNNNTRLFSLPIVHENTAFRSKLQAALPAASKTRLEFGLQDSKVFLFVGRLVKIKNVSFLISAFANHLSDKADAVLVIIGEGDEHDSLVNLAKERGVGSKCLFLGRLEGEALHTWFLIAHCLVLPSYQEPYGAVVNEALLSGCKVLCSGLAGASELITTANGSVFDPFNIDDLSQLIVSYYHDFQINSRQIELKPDLMPFQLISKLSSLILFLKH